MSAPPIRIGVTLAGRRLLIESDDDSIVRQAFITFGAGDGRDLPPFLHATLRRETTALMLEVRLEGVTLPPSALLFGLDVPDCPYELIGDEVVAPGRGETQFTLDGDRLLVHETPLWREAVTALLARVFRRFNDDVIFFHAAAAAIAGGGLLLLGAQHAGKSTLALALAARGHDFLSDEFGCYDPRSHELIPYRRPVGIRQGPRAAAVEQALARGGFLSFADGDSLRVDPAALLQLGPERRVPLRAVLFIDGFGDRSALRDVDPGRTEVGMLQTLYSSLTNASHGRRAFELIRMLGRSRVAYLTVGDPDRTALLLEEEFSS